MSDYARRYVQLPDHRFARPFQEGSLAYWEAVRDVMRIAGAPQEEAEALIKRQRCCIPSDRP